jgi:HEAT repeats
MESFDSTRPESVTPATMPPTDLLAQLHQRIAARRPYLNHSEQTIVGLNDPRWEIRAAAARALGSVSQSGEDVIALLRQTLRDVHPMVRAAAVRSLGQHGALSDVALAFHDTDWAVREIVVVTLADAEVSLSHPVMQAAQLDACSQVREVAMQIAREQSGHVLQENLTSLVKQGRGGMTYIRQLFFSQIRLIHPGIWWVPGGTMAVTTGFAAFTVTHTPGFGQIASVLIALVTMLCTAVSLAFLADVQYEPALEIILATRTSFGAVVLSRGLIVAAYLALLGVVCSTLVAIASGIPPGVLIGLWAQPMLTLVAASLALAVVAGSAVATLGSVILIGIQTCRVSLTHGFSLVLSAHFWQFSPLIFGSSILLFCFATVFATRRARLPRVTL